MPEQPTFSSLREPSRPFAGNRKRVSRVNLTTRKGDWPLRRCDGAPTAANSAPCDSEPAAYRHGGRSHRPAPHPCEPGARRRKLRRTTDELRGAAVELPCSTGESVCCRRGACREVLCAVAEAVLHDAVPSVRSRRHPVPPPVPGQGGSDLPRPRAHSLIPPGRGALRCSPILAACGWLSTSGAETLMPCCAAVLRRSRPCSRAHLCPGEAEAGGRGGPAAAMGRCQCP